MMPDDFPYDLDLRAYLALSGASLDWRTDLAALLRSDLPLSRLLRDRLANLIDEGDDGRRLELTGHKPNRHRFAGVASRYEWMEIGRWVDNRRRLHPDDPQSAVEAASHHFTLGEKKVEAAVSYYNKTSSWVEKALGSEDGQALGREWLERLYHSITVSPEMKKLNQGLVKRLGLSN